MKLFVRSGLTAFSGNIATAKFTYTSLMGENLVGNTDHWNRTYGAFTAFTHLEQLVISSLSINEIAYE